MTGSQFQTIYGRESPDLRSQAVQPGVLGARAALESFYHAFNQRSMEVFEAVWAPDEQISLANPLGGILSGSTAIAELYRRIFNGPAQVWVELYDVVEYATDISVVFVGRERGVFALAEISVPLAIRTTRVLHYLGTGLGWRQVHHHGSIDNPETLERYQQAVRGNS